MPTKRYLTLYHVKSHLPINKIEMCIWNLSNRSRIMSEKVENRSFVVLKLVTGDQLIGEHVFLDSYIFDGTVKIKKPMIISSASILSDAGKIIEYLIGVPYCVVTDDEIYEFDQSHIVFMNTLAPEFIEYYEKMVRKYAEKKSELLKPVNEETLHNVLEDKPIIPSSVSILRADQLEPEEPKKP